MIGELRAHFRPEFLNRVGDTVLFAPLGLLQIERIVDLQFEQLRQRLAEQQIELHLSEDARLLIAVTFPMWWKRRWAGHCCVAASRKAEWSQ